MMNVGKSESPTKMARADFFILRGLLTLLGTDSGTMTWGSGADGQDVQWLAAVALSGRC